MNAKLCLASRPVALLMVVLALSNSSAAQSGRGWMKGIVLGVSESQGMRGALVELSGDPHNPTRRDVAFDTRTDEAGRYAFKNVPNGEYTFRVSAEGFVPYEITVYIPSDAETQLHVRLRAKTR
jgi:hypothetical protein